MHRVWLLCAVHVLEQVPGVQRQGVLLVPEAVSEINVLCVCGGVRPERKPLGPWGGGRALGLTSFLNFYF